MFKPPKGCTNRGLILLRDEEQISENIINVSVLNTNNKDSGENLNPSRVDADVFKCRPNSVKQEHMKYSRGF